MSAFSATGRDTFRRPQATRALDPGFITAPQEALSAIQTANQNSVVTDLGSALSSSLCIAVQRWLWTNDGSLPNGGTVLAPIVLLSVSPAILEDAGLTFAQGENPTVSLASSRALDPGAPPIAVDLSGTQGLALPTPGWVTRLRRAPLVSFSARQIGATGNQAVGITNHSFFDAGSGSSPMVVFSLSYSSPDLLTTALPTGSYEISLLLMGWGR